MDILPLLLKDGYKVGHKFQYPEDTEFVYSNLTARKSRTELQGVIFFGLQYFMEEYLQRQFNENFFNKDRYEVIKEYSRRIDNYLGKDAITYDHIVDLHQLGYLPICIKALPEGTFVPCQVPMLTIRNTHKDFYWLTNMLETLLSNILWKCSTSATTAFQYRKAFEQYALLTGAPKEFVQWQGHDFSFRGMSGVEDAMLNGAAHLLSFTGTDTIPAIDFLEKYYQANSDIELVGGSVPATEHSVMSMGLEDNEVETFKRLLTKVYPKGIVSIVSDTWDFWNIMKNGLLQLRDIILAREGKLVIRPDSGNPVLIICGDPESKDPYIRAGTVERLWEVFGGKINGAGFKELDPHVGVIYGDSINLQRQQEILSRLAAKGFASTNIVLGIGSYTYQYVTRDTYGFAMKATWGYTKSKGGVAIFKDPKTDDGTKKSHRGLLHVKKENGKLVCVQDCSPQEENFGLLEVVFRDGEIVCTTSLKEIRKRINAQL